MAGRLAVRILLVSSLVLYLELLTQITKTYSFACKLPNLYIPVGVSNITVFVNGVLIVINSYILAAANVSSVYI